MTTAMSSRVDRGSKVRPLLKSLLMTSGVVLALAGCSSVQLTKRPEIVGAVPTDYRTNHPITIEDSIETFDLPVGSDSGRLTADERGNVAGFAQRFMDSGSPTIAIVAPSGSPNQRVAAGTTLEVQDVLLRAGVARRAIEFRVYQAGPGERNAPVRIAYQRVAAKTAPCGPWPDQVARSNENDNYYNFGCATQQNLAAMVANPLDLLYPRVITPADAKRRAKVLGSYENADSTQGDYSKEPGGSVAQGVGSQ